MIILFWVLLSLVIYCYFGYPLLIFLLARFKHDPVYKADITPAISIVLSLYNEEDVIAAKIKNLLELEYPVEKMEILIGLDGSTDRTEDILRQFSDPRIKLHVNPRRQGKMATINELALKAKNEVIVFTDARQIFEKNAVKRMAADFSDPKIGAVSGELIFAPKEGGTARGVDLYWKYEKFIRRQESRVHSIMGATGAIYAIRKELFVPGPANIVLDDMYIPFKVIQQGYRVLFNSAAFAYDQVANNPQEEYRRKTRTLYGNYQIFAIFPGLFNPFKSPIAWQLFSHKFLRVIIPFFLIALLMINYMLRLKPVFNVFLYLQIVFYVMALIGDLARDYKDGVFKFISKICYVPYVFCLLNFSAFVGFWRFIFARQQITWTKARNIEDPSFKQRPVSLSLLQAIVLAILLIAASLPTILWMWDRWFAAGSYYNHGILIPIVSLLLVWRKKDIINKLPVESSPWGLKLFILGLILYWISALLHVYFSSGFSMLIVTAGLILHFYGEKTFRETLFPLLFLVFMIPAPLIVVAFICFKLKVLAAQLATIILNLIGLPAILQSTIIQMRHSYVLVEDSCGGLRSLISLTALGSIFAYQLRSGLFRKMLLFISAVPIATITNACRIVFLSAVGEIWGTQYTRALHDLSGYLVFAFAFLLLFALKKLLE